MNGPIVPGVYIEEQKYSLSPMQIDNRCLAAFAGIAERGPVHTPVYIRSFDEYLQNFGSFDTAGLLPVSIYNFFKCGGSECIVVRVVTEEQADRSEAKIACTSGSFTLSASSPGTWGNYLHFRIRHEGEPIGNITDIDPEGRWVEFAEIPDEVRIKDVLRFSFSNRTFNRTVKAVKNRRVFLSKNLKIIGTAYGDDLCIKAEKLFFCLRISQKNRIESFNHVSLNPEDERYFLDILKQSKLCTIKSHNCSGVPEVFYTRYAAGGSDGITELTAGDFIGYYKGLDTYKGIGCFEAFDNIALTAVPDLFWLLSVKGKTRQEQLAGIQAVQDELVRQTERFPGRFAVLDMPEDLSFLEMSKWSRRIDSPNAAIYYPFIHSIDPLDPAGSGTIKVPPSSSICGCISAVDNSKGIFHAPANIIISGAASVSVPVGEAECESLYPDGINVLRYFPGKGVKIWGTRTTSSCDDWKYINVRRTFLRICKSLKQGSQWSVFEVNDKNLRKRIVRQVSGFLIDLWRKGYLAGSSAENAFYVRCDEELNPPDHIDKGVLCFEVGLAITKPVEFFTIKITAEKEGASVYIGE